MEQQYAWTVTYASAILLFLIVRSTDLIVLAKTDAQRTKDERFRVSRGLARSLFLELLIFVPASATLLLLLVPFLLPALPLSAQRAFASHAVIGLVSYGFPFSAVRQLLTRVALNTLKEFATLQPQATSTKDEP